MKNIIIIIYNSLPGNLDELVLIKDSKTLNFAHFAQFLAIYGQISRELDFSWTFDLRWNDEEHNSNRFNSFPFKTNDSILIKISKTLILAHFVHFSAIFDQISGKPDFLGYPSSNKFKKNMMVIILSHF